MRTEFFDKLYQNCEGKIEIRLLPSRKQQYFDISDHEGIDQHCQQYKGENTYFTGKPCKHGHISPRYTGSHGCIQCQRERSTKRHDSTVKKIRKMGLPADIGASLVKLRILVNARIVIGHTKIYIIVPGNTMNDKLLRKAKSIINHKNIIFGFEQKIRL